MRVNCVVCYDSLMENDDIHAAPCGHMLHFRCWIQWLQRTRNCPECRKPTSENQLIRLYFNAGGDDEYSTLMNKCDVLECELQCSRSEVQDANKLVLSQKKDIVKLELKIMQLKLKLKEPGSVHAAGNTKSPEYWSNKLLKYKEDMKYILEDKDTTIENCQLEIQRLKREVRVLAAQENGQRGLHKSLSPEEKRRRELSHQPRGCVLHFPRIPVHFKGDHFAFRREIQRLGGRVAFVTYKCGDTEAYVRLQAGRGNQAQNFLLTLPTLGNKEPFVVIENVVMCPKVLKGEEELNFLKWSLEERDRRRAETWHREESTGISTVHAGTEGPSRIYRVNPALRHVTEPSISAELVVAEPVVAEPVRASFPDIRDEVNSSCLLM